MNILSLVPFNFHQEIKFIIQQHTPEICFESLRQNTTPEFFSQPFTLCSHLERSLMCDKQANESSSSNTFRSPFFSFIMHQNPFDEKVKEEEGEDIVIPYFFLSLSSLESDKRAVVFFTYKI